MKDVEMARSEISQTRRAKTSLFGMLREAVEIEAAIGREIADRVRN
jgi:hypothetical protein